MIFNSTEKEFISAIITYEGKAKSLAEVLNKSKLLEKKGIGIVQYEGKNIIFLRKDLYDDWFHNDGLGYVVELLSLIDTLIKKKYIIMIPFCTDNILMVGADACWLRPEVMSVNGNQFVTLTYRNENGLDSFGNQLYWPCKYTEQELPMGNLFHCAFSVSEELRELVKNNFRSEDEIRFRKQQCLTWVSIIAATLIGILGIIF